MLKPLYGAGAAEKPDEMEIIIKEFVSEYHMGKLVFKAGFHFLKAFNIIFFTDFYLINFVEILL